VRNAPSRLPKLLGGFLANFRFKRIFAQKVKYATRITQLHMRGGSYKLSPVQSQVRRHRILPHKLTNLSYRLLSSHRTNSIRILRRGPRGFRFLAFKRTKPHSRLYLAKRSLVKFGKPHVEQIHCSHKTPVVMSYKFKPDVRLVSGLYAAEHPTDKILPKPIPNLAAFGSERGTLSTMFFKQPIVRYKPGLLRY